MTSSVYVLGTRYSMANGSTCSDSGSDLAALLEEELDAVSLPGSPKYSIVSDSAEETRQAKR